VPISAKPPEPLALEEEEAEHLIGQAEQGALSAAEQKRLAQVLRVF
jgi:hypothetical protein